MGGRWEEKLVRESHASDDDFPGLMSVILLPVRQKLF